VHKAVDFYQYSCQQHAYVLKLDIARYFPSINHVVLKRQLSSIIKDNNLLCLLSLIVDQSPSLKEGVGLPIGNLTSQYFANLYLNNIDHWVCQQPEVGAYLRYVDDLIVLGRNKDELWYLKNRLEKELDDIGLRLHDKKQQLMRTSERVDVLGYVISPKRRWLRNDNGYRFKRKLDGYVYRYALDELEWPAISASVRSWIGHSTHAETHSLRYLSIVQKGCFYKTLIMLYGWACTDVKNHEIWIL